MRKKGKLLQFENKVLIIYGRRHTSVGVYLQKILLGKVYFGPQGKSFRERLKKGLLRTGIGAWFTGTLVG